MFIFLKFFDTDFYAGKDFCGFREINIFCLQHKLRFKFVG